MTYQDCMDTEQEGSRAIDLHLQNHYDFHIWTNRLPTKLSAKIQPVWGDLILFNGWDVCTAEVKVERKSTGNFFIEKYSNRFRDTPGWVSELRCALLMYLFLDEMKLYIIDMRKLNAHAEKWWVPHYRLIRQRKHEQPNDTWGWIQDITQVMFNVGIGVIDLKQYGVEPIGQVVLTDAEGRLF